MKVYQSTSHLDNPRCSFDESELSLSRDRTEEAASLWEDLTTQERAEYVPKSYKGSLFCLRNCLDEQPEAIYNNFIKEVN